MIEVSQYPSTAASDLENGLLSSDASLPMIIRPERGQKTRENNSEVIVIVFLEFS